MDRFFKKSGTIVADDKKEIKVTYSADPQSKSELEKIKEQTLQEKSRLEDQELRELKKRKVYEFTSEMKTDEEQLDDFLM